MLVGDWSLTPGQFSLAMGLSLASLCVPESEHNLFRNLKRLKLHIDLGRRSGQAWSVEDTVPLLSLAAATKKATKLEVLSFGVADEVLASIDIQCLLQNTWSNLISVRF